MKTVNRPRNLIENEFKEKYEALLTKSDMAETKVFCHNNIQLKNLLHKQVTFNFEPVEEEKKNPDQIEEEDAYSGTEESMCDDT